MKNVKITMKDNILLLAVDLSKVQGPSKTGKTIVIATTEGNQEVPGNPLMRFGLNVYQYKEAKE